MKGEDGVKEKRDNRGNNPRAWVMTCDVRVILQDYKHPSSSYSDALLGCNEQNIE